MPEIKRPKFWGLIYFMYICNNKTEKHMANFNNIKVGDKVLIYVRRGHMWRGTTWCIGITVDKVTNTQFRAGSRRFFKKDGAQWGTDGTKSAHVYDEAKDEIEEYRNIFMA